MDSCCRGGGRWGGSGLSGRAAHLRGGGRTVEVSGTRTLYCTVQSLMEATSYLVRACWVGSDGVFLVPALHSSRRSPGDGGLPAPPSLPPPPLPPPPRPPLPPSQPPILTARRGHAAAAAQPKTPRAQQARRPPQPGLAPHGPHRRCRRGVEATAAAAVAPPPPLPGGRPNGPRSVMGGGSERHQRRVGAAGALLLKTRGQPLSQARDRLRPRPGNASRGRLCPRRCGGEEIKKPIPKTGNGGRMLARPVGH